MLFLQFILHFSSFVGTVENNIPGAALEPCQLEIKQLSPGILKFSTEHRDNPFTLNCSMVPRTFLFTFHAGSRRLVSNNFRNSSYEKNPGQFGPCFQTIFPFLMNTVRPFLSNAVRVYCHINYCTIKTKSLNNTTLMVEPEGKLP